MSFQAAECSIRGQPLHLAFGIDWGSTQSQIVGEQRAIRPGQLAAVRTGDVRDPARVDEPRKPELVGGNGILNKEHKVLASRQTGSMITSSTMAEFARRDRYNPDTCRMERLNGSIRGAGVHGNDLVGPVGLLPLDCLQNSSEDGQTIASYQQD